MPLLSWYPLSNGAVDAAYRYVGTREVGGQNRGPVVEMFQRRLGLPVGSSWCMAFVFTCFDDSAATLDMPNMLVRTGGCVDHWNHANPETRVPVLKFDPAALHRGSIFVIDHGISPTTGYHRGHTGLVTDFDTATMMFATVEGNTNMAGSRNGDGVYIRSRHITEINVGFIDYSKLGDPAKYVLPDSSVA